MLDPLTLVYPFDGQNLELNGLQGHTCSILPLGGPLQKVFLEGFRYPLQGEALGHQQTRGLSNRIEGPRASIRASAGQALILICREGPETFGP